jgi:hypothetical protein
VAVVPFEHRAAYPPFKLPEDGSVMTRARYVVESPVPKPIPLFSNGGPAADRFGKRGADGDARRRVRTRSTR